MIRDEDWPIARLIPIASGTNVEAQERRAASALLAVIAAVPDFGRALLRPLGAPAGKIQTYIETPFKRDGKEIRPDGIITVARAGKTWSPIVETKVVGNSIDPQQMDLYLDLARDLDFQAVLSISNQYVTSSREYPVAVDRRKLRKVGLHHWSWIDVLSEAVVQKEHRGISDSDQAYILNELIRYLSDPRSGAVTFDSMGSSWARVRDGARNRTLRKTDADVSDVAARWDDLVRYLGLDLTMELGRDVKQLLSQKERTPTQRLAALKESLAESGRLYAELQIPDVAAPLRVVADLGSRQVMTSTRIDAPKEGRSRGRVSWLLRQLQTAPAHLKVEARLARTSDSLAASLEETRENWEALNPPGEREIRQFVLTLTRNMGLKSRVGRGSFITAVVDAAKDFYGGVLQNLRPWKPPPPRLKPPVEEEPTELESPAVDEAIEEAQEEMASQVGEDPASPHS